MNKTIEKIFGSRIRAKIFGWLFTHPDESFFVRQIALILKEDPTNMSREIAKLEELGILRSKRNGNLKHFQANQECPFFEELKGLVLKTSGVEAQGERRFQPKPLGKQRRLESNKRCEEIEYCRLFAVRAERAGRIK